MFGRNWDKLEEEARLKSGHLSRLGDILEAQCFKIGATPRPAEMERKKGKVYGGWLSDANAFISKVGYNPVPIPADPLTAYEGYEFEENFQFYALRSHYRNYKNKTWLASIPLAPGDPCMSVMDSAREWDHDYEIDEESSLAHNGLSKVVYIGGFEYHIRNMMHNSSIGDMEPDLRRVVVQSPTGQKEVYNNLEQDWHIWNSRLNRSLGSSPSAQSLEFAEKYLLEDHVRGFGLIKDPLVHIEDISLVTGVEFKPKSDAHSEVLERIGAARTERLAELAREQDESRRERYKDEVKALEAVIDRENFYQQDDMSAIF